MLFIRETGRKGRPLLESCVKWILIATASCAFVLAHVFNSDLLQHSHLQMPGRSPGNRTSVDSSLAPKEALTATSTSASTTSTIVSTTNSGGFQEKLEKSTGLTAMCVVGGMRSFQYTKIHQSILNFKMKVDATLFLVMHETFSPGPEKYVQIPFKVDQSSLKKAFDLLRPAHVEIHNASTCQTFATVEPATCCDDAWMANYLQLGWIQHCFNVVKRYEVDHQVRFELFARVRPDVIYFDLGKLPSEERLRTNGITVQQKGGPKDLADWLFIATRHSMDWFFDTMQDVQRHCDQKHACEESGTKCKRDTTFMAPEYSG
eukprot:symbB.v1.2.038746.t1/scaffold6054.1/size21370/1